MKGKNLLLACAVASLMTTACSNDNNREELFNGKDLSGWVLYASPDSDVPANEVFTVGDGVIKVLGNPYGYMRTAKKYADFKAHCEYRWTDGKGSNSGFFLRLQEGDTMWPGMVECQLQAGHAGDLLGGGLQIAENPDRPGFKRQSRSEDAGNVENGIDEWNSVDVSCIGSHITITVNGTVVNEAETSLTEGFLALQSEGGPLEFRNVWVEEVKPATGAPCNELVQNAEPLFNGKDLSGWVLVTDSTSSVKPEEVFTVKDGVISVLGNPFGYMRTDRQFSNYRLRAEWRWVGGKATNSGIFQRIQPGDGVWPVGMECQLAGGNAGAVVGLNGYQVADAVQNGAFGVKDRLADPSEKEVGEWNVAEIECIGKHMKITINGVVQNEADGQYSRGFIALQSEGGPLEFRNVEITAL